MSRSIKSKLVKFYVKSLLPRLLRKEIFYIVSYPKSGRTWLRAALSKLLSLEYCLPEDFLFTKELRPYRYIHIPDIYFQHNDLHYRYADMMDVSRGCENLKKGKYRHYFVILLVRDPRDVIVSSYFHMTRRDKRYEGDLSSFIRDDKFGIKSIIFYMNNWAENRSQPKKFMCISYEDMQNDLSRELAKIGSFLRMSFKPESISKAVNYSSFSNMKDMESNRTINHYSLRATDHTDKYSFKVREGKVGGYKNYFTQEDANYVNSLISQELDDFYSFYK